MLTLLGHRSQEGQPETREISSYRSDSPKRVAMSFNPAIEIEHGSFLWKLQNYSVHAKNVKIESPFFNTGTIVWSLALGKETAAVVFRVLGNSESFIKCIFVQIDIEVISVENVRTLLFKKRFETDNRKVYLKEVVAAQNLLSEHLVNDSLEICFKVAFTEIGKFTATTSYVHYDPDSTSSSIETLYSDIKSYRLTHNSGDVVLQCEEQKFRVHKFILSARSPVFQRMFANDMQENLHSAVSIPDVSAPVLSQMISYMYGQEVDDASVCIGLYSAADKYCMQHLKQRCARGLERSLTVEMVCEVAALAHLHQDGPLYASAKSFISSHVAEVFCTRGWIELAAKQPALASDIAVTAATHL